MVKVGYACGTCPRCGRNICGLRPADIAVCDCREYCPLCGEKMEHYTPDLTPSTYRPAKVHTGTVRGDLEHPMQILFRCPMCNYQSSQKPVEVKLT